MVRTTSRVLALAILTTLSSIAQAAEREVRLSELDLSYMSQDFGSPRVDRSVENRPLTIAGKTFERGIGSHAESQFNVRVNGAKRFLATVGVDDETNGRGNVRFLVSADGKVLFDSGPMKGGEAGKDVDVDVAGKKELILSIQAEHGITYAHANWAAARFIVDGEAPAALLPPSEVAEILTPPAPKTPRINGPKLFGVRPGSPILFNVPVTGDRPMRYEATNLPEGATFDATTGRFGGAVKKAGTYVVRLKATNALGTAERDFKLVIGDELALTPPMGWNSWNSFFGNVDAEKMKAATDHLVASGLADHGYSYVNIDDYWQQKPERMAVDPTLGGPGRDEQGNIVPNPRFPDMKGLADYVHSKGFKFGIYSSPGPYTCGHCLGSFGYEAQDAAKYAEWGVDYLKYDWCSYRPDIESRRDAVAKPGATTYPVGAYPKPTREQAMLPYARMGELLQKQNRDIVYSLCQYGGNNVWEWARDVRGDVWRTTGDIVDTWPSMSKIGFSQNEKLGTTGPGGWSDPDMLTVGKVGFGKPHMTRLTPNEQYTHITLWSILPAPLLIGCDLTVLDAFTLSLLSNDEVIAVNQDALGKQARRVAKTDTTEVWSKQLEDGALAVALFNRGESEGEVVATWSDLGLSGKQAVRDLWRQQDVGEVEDAYRVMVPRHGVRFVKLATKP